MLPRHVSLLAAAFRTTQTSGRARQRPVLCLGSSIHGLGASRSPPRSESGQSQGVFEIKLERKAGCKQQIGRQRSSQNKQQPESQTREPRSYIYRGWGWESCGEAAMIAEREQAVVLVVCVLLRAAALPAPCFCAAHPLFSSRPPLRDDTSSSPSSLQRPSFS